MTAFALISGKLHGEPVTRPTKNGGQVTFFKLKVANGSAIEFWSCATFSDSAREELEGMAEGAAVSATGTLQVETFSWRGETRINRKLTADRLMGLNARPREAKRKTKAEAPPAPPGWDDATYAAGDPDDALPF